VIAVAAAVGALLLLLLVRRLLRARREAAYMAQRRREVRDARGHLYMEQEELDRLAQRIQATSSTGAIAGYDIVRQIEAVFTDGHLSPAKAVEVLKARAAEKGANAIINLGSERGTTGKYVARGDAVIVRAIER
jgi:hypothetical protein